MNDRDRNSRLLQRRRHVYGYCFRQSLPMAWRIRRKCCYLDGTIHGRNNPQLPGQILSGGCSSIPSFLINAVREAALSAACHRVWLITTNDNIQALRFYQRRGFELVAVHRDAIKESRKLKPEIPEVGMHGIPLRDEIELELKLTISREGK